MVTLLLVRARRYEPARVAAALAVAFIIAGWAAAQSPELLPGLTIDEAAAGHSTLVALVIAVAAGLLVLAPSLTLLFRLTLAGRFDPGAVAVTQPRVRDRRGQYPGPRIVVAGGLLFVGCSLTVLSDATWGLALGVASLLGFLATAFAPLADPREPDDAWAPVDAVVERGA